jgi:hypothetical protein
VVNYGLDCRGFESRQRLEIFLFTTGSPTGSGAHPASYPLGSRGAFLGGKAAGVWIWPLTSIYCQGQRMSGATPRLLKYAFMAWCSVQKTTGTTLLLLQHCIASEHRITRPGHFTYTTDISRVTLNWRTSYNYTSGNIVKISHPRSTRSEKLASKILFQYKMGGARV